MDAVPTPRPDLAAIAMVRAYAQAEAQALTDYAHGAPVTDPAQAAPVHDLWEQAETAGGGDARALAMALADLATDALTTLAAPRHTDLADLIDEYEMHYLTAD